MLDKALKFSTAKTHYAQDNREEFIGVIMWARREPKQILNIINPSTNQHTKATLNSIIPKTHH